MVKPEYLMVYTQAGLPIYSKCFGSFCKAAFKNPELLTGFLSALETIPLTISPDLGLETVKMGPTSMRFSKTIPTGHSVVVGMDEYSQEVADRVFEAVSEVLNKERFRNQDWTGISTEVMEDFKKELLGSALNDALHDHGGFEDECPLGNQCPMHTLATQSTRERIWSAIKGKYSALREKMKRK